MSRILVAFLSLWIVFGFIPPKSADKNNVNAFGKLPILNGGRIKPMDTLARNSLLVLSGKQTVRAGDQKIDALPWFLDVLFHAEKAAAYKVFTIDHPDVLGTLGIMQAQERRFSFRDLQDHIQDINTQAAQVEETKPEQRTPYQRAIVTLHQQISLYQKLQNTLQVAGTEHPLREIQDFELKLEPALKAHVSNPAAARKLLAPLFQDLERFRFLDQSAEFYALPPMGWWSGEAWQSMGAGLLNRLRIDAFHPGIIAYARLGEAWREENFSSFNLALADYENWLTKMAQKDYAHAKREYLFNTFQPFYRSMVIYVITLLAAFLSWVIWPKDLNRTAYTLLILAFIIHTAGLAWRIILQGRPPVTNLYSSAIFVGWVAVLLGLVLERLYRNGVGSAVGSAIGFMTLIVAHHLATTGDTLEMMRAVLDSNFWLATHVVTITVGYGSTFLSGFLGIVYIVRQRFDRSWTNHAAATLERMVYGVVCFSLLFSFIGTILGGIWADQSWGRFWGWDPKENGALMIVLWNALILHARIGKIVDRRGVMAMAIFGNVVTAFSWFGVNMLGIGLHSYGFMDKAFFWLLAFSASQLVFIGLAIKSRE